MSSSLCDGSEQSHLSSHQLLDGGSRDLFIRCPTINPCGQGTSGLTREVLRVMCAICTAVARRGDVF